MLYMLNEKGIITSNPLPSSYSHTTSRHQNDAPPVPVAPSKPVLHLSWPILLSSSANESSVPTSQSCRSIHQIGLYPLLTSEQRAFSKPAGRTNRPDTNQPAGHISTKRVRQKNQAFYLLLLLLPRASSSFLFPSPPPSHLHQMRRQQEIRNPLLNRILMPTIPTHQLPLPYTRLQQYPMQIPRRLRRNLLPLFVLLPFFFYYPAFDEIRFRWDGFGEGGEAEL
jgi:hypothetical protein